MALTIEQEQALLALLNEKKITLSELPAATEVNEDDLMLIRQGILDKSVNSLVMKRHFTPTPASLTASGITKLSNAIDSDDDYIAATSKAVKTAHDLAIKASSEVSSKSLSKSANLSDVTDVDAVLENLGLLEAAKRNVGIGVNQIPDMSYQGYGPNWVKTVGGLIIQKGSLGFDVGTNLSSTTFPVAFASTPVVNLTWSDVTLGGADPSLNMSYGVVVDSQTRTGFQAWMTGYGGYNLSYIAVGY